MITRLFCCWMFWLIIDCPDIQIITFLRGFVLELRVKDCQSNVINDIKFITYMLTWLKSEMWSVCYLYEFALFGILYLSTRRHKKKNGCTEEYSFTHELLKTRSMRALLHTNIFLINQYQSSKTAQLILISN